MHKDHILVIGDTHIPFEETHYLDFCLQVKKRVRCDTVVHIGDLVDNHSMSYHEHDPNGLSPSDEIKKAKKHLDKWYKAFPKLYLCRGNHDRMVDRKGKTAGLPSVVFRPFRYIWDLPKGWVDDWDFEFYGVRFQHGTGYSGKYAHMNAAYDNRQSTIIGHTHSALAGGYICNYKNRIYGMNVGCGINRKRYAFAYGKDFRFKPLVGCGVITDNGRYWQVFPMDI